MILLDADVAIEILRQRPAAVQWFLSLPAHEVLALPGFVVMELASGCQTKKELRQLQKWLMRFRILWLPQNQAHLALRDYFTVTLRNVIGVIDFLVARIAVFHGVALHTFNVKHFRAVSGLRVIVPYRR